MFRTEVLAAAQTGRTHGDILLARPPGHGVLVVLFATAAAAVVLFLCFFSVTRKAQVEGVLMPSQGLIRVVAGQSGVIAERRVANGTAVRAGDVLFMLASDRASATVGDTAHTISALIQSRRASLLTERAQQRVQIAERIEAARSRSQQTKTELQRIEEQIGLQQRRVTLADDALRRYQDLQRSGFVSSAQVEDRQAQWIEQLQRLADLQRARAANTRDWQAVQSEISGLQLQAARDEEAAMRSIAALDQDLAENEARRELLVRAPQDGVATAINAERGQAVASGQVLLAILPRGSELEAELHVPSRSAGFISAGTEVLLRYHAYPHQKFGQFRGVVREVSQASQQPADLNTYGNETLYRVRAKLERQSVRAYGAERALKAGMTLQASIVLERRRLIEWVLDPLYAISGRL
ncbi:MAG: HlyD family secretion protein [Pseudomonadota bacterium]